MARTQVETPVSDRSAHLYVIMRATFVVRTALLDALQQKAGFRPDQPRMPAGNPEGGRWVDEDGDADLILVNGDPSEFPDAPEEPPATTKERNIWSRRVARFLFATNGVVQAEVIRRWIWVHARARIAAYLRPPQYLDVLRRSVKDPQPGYDIHHIVEQTPARQDGFPEELIEGWENKVLIPTYRHWEITAWFGTKNSRFNGSTPRDFLHGQPWHVRKQVGLDAMRLFGVLK